MTLTERTHFVLERLVGALALPPAPAVRQLTEERDELVKAGRVVRAHAQGGVQARCPQPHRHVPDTAVRPAFHIPSWRLPRARLTVALSTAAMLIQHRYRAQL
jgi:hypothetical protein